jgi:uncharacterized protein (TIRG00374 family)
MSRSLRRNLIIVLILGVGLYLVLGLYADLGDLLEAFENFQWQMLPAALALVSLSYGFRYLRWEYLLRRIDIKIAVLPSILIFLSGLMMAISPAKLGEIIKSFLLKDQADVKISRSSPIIVMERLTDLIAVVILGGVGSLAYGAGEEILVATIILVSAFIIIVQWRSLSLKLLKLSESIPLVNRISRHLEEFYESSYSLVKARNLLPAVLISTISWFIECVASWLLLKGLGYEMELLLVVFIFVIATLAGALAMIPGGLGVAEASMTGLFIRNGIDKSGAVAATLLIRLTTFWFTIILGLIGMTLYGVFYSKKPETEVSSVTR